MTYLPQHSFHTLGINYVGSGNNWILTAVCPYFNLFRDFPVLNKTAFTAARTLLHEVLLPFGPPPFAK